MTSKLYLTKRKNGYYYIGFFEGNRRKWKTTKCTTKSDALQFLRSFEGTKKDAERTPLLSELFTRFESMRGNSVRPSTMASYRLAVNRFKDVCGDKVIDQYTFSDIERFKNAQLEQKVSKISVNIWLRGVKSVLGFAVRHEWLTKNPVQRSLEFVIPQQSPTYVSKEDFQTLLGKVTVPVLRDLFLFAALSGLRLSEILNLKWSAVDFEKRQFTVSNSETFTTKTGKERTVPMHEEVYKVLSLRRGNGTEDGLVFCKRGGFRLERNYVSKTFKGYVRDAELSEKLHFHSLRHSCASWLVDAGVSLYVVQNILGHSNISTTQIYSHLSQNTLHESVNRVALCG
jgi:site-specific recombinase XerD